MFGKSETYTMNGIPVTMHKNGRVDVGLSAHGEPVIILTQWLDGSEYVITGTVYHESQMAVLETAMPNLKITPSGIRGQWNVSSR